MTSRFTLTRTLPANATAAALATDVSHGLTRFPKTLPPRWFYDARGSELFEQITKLGVYYPTRAEAWILQETAPRIAQLTGARTLVELGSGSSYKTRLLLDALGTPLTYVPVDVSESALADAGHALLADHPGVTVHALVADFQQRLPLPQCPEPKIIAFLGGTVGNLLPGERARFLTSLRARLGPEDALLLGTDLVKDPAVLVAAYDDQDGVTAAFNKNVLHVLNREMGADFDPDDFSHVAVWDSENEWIEMRLRASRALSAKLPVLDLSVDFQLGEELRTEISAKFRPHGVRAELAAAGLRLHRWWTDPGHRFALGLAVPAPDAHEDPPGA